MSCLNMGPLYITSFFSLLKKTSNKKRSYALTNLNDYLWIESRSSFCFPSNLIPILLCFCLFAAAANECINKNDSIHTYWAKLVCFFENSAYWLLNHLTFEINKYHYISNKSKIVICLFLLLIFYWISFHFLIHIEINDGLKLM